MNADGPRFGRRSLLAGGLIASGAAPLVAACSVGERAGTPTGAGTGGGSETPARVQRIDYGPSDASQFADLVRPEGASKGVVVVIHGGFWQFQYDLTLGQPLAASLAAEGWTAYNIEYRRGGGGGWPETFDDVAAAIDALADVEDVDLGTVLALGHSAGGHLAVWAAARSGLPPWRPVRVPVTGCVAQAGVLDLEQAYRDRLGGDAVRQFLGRGPGEGYDLVDPVRQVPLDVPVRCIHGSDDTTVPIAQSQAYVDAATAAGADATLTRVDGDHFTLIDVRSEAWSQTLALLDGMR